MATAPSARSDVSDYEREMGIYITTIKKGILKMEFNPQWERPVSTFVVDTVLEKLDIASEEMVDPSHDSDDSYELGFKTLQLCMELMRTHDCGEFSDIETEIISNTFNTAIITMAHSIMDTEDC